MVGNTVFTPEPIGRQLTAANRIVNIEEDTPNATDFVWAPSTITGQRDFYPLPYLTLGAPLNLSDFSFQENFDRDFNNGTKGINPGWLIR